MIFDEITRYQYPAGADVLWKLLKEEDEVAVDTETNGLHPYKGDRIWGMSLYFPKAKVSFYVPVRYSNGVNITPKEYSKLLGKLSTLENLVFFNAKFDLHMMYQDGFKQPSQIEDVMIAAHLLNENEYISNGGQVAGAYKLKRLAKKYLGVEAGAGEAELLANAKKRGIDPKSGMWQLPPEDVALYAMMDTEITWGLREYYRPHLEKWHQWDLYKTKNEVLLKVIMRMEMNGMMVNVDTIKAHIADIAPRVADYEAQFDKWLEVRGLKFTNDKDERRINLNSPTQVKAMFEAFGYPVANTDQYTMRDLTAKGVKIAERLIEYRQQAKAASTYYEPYLLFVDEYGVIHHSLSLTGTVTRRLSSMEPNFQNIPRKNGKLLVKQVFIPRPGYAMLQFDYKALELRLGIHFANELVMRKLLAEGHDLHQFTADQLGISRDDGKRYNFGLTYGMGWKKAARIYGMSEKDAKAAIEGWHKLYPAFRKALGVWERVAKTWRTINGKKGGDFQFVRLMNGVTRHYNEYAADMRYDGEYRGAWNFVVQGTGAIIAETSALRVVERFPDNNIVKPINAVHDSLMVEVRLDKINEVVPVIKQLMEDWPQFSPSMEVDVEITDTSWYDMRKYVPEEWA